MRVGMTRCSETLRASDHKDPGRRSSQIPSCALSRRKNEIRLLEILIGLLTGTLNSESTPFTDSVPCAGRLHPCPYFRRAVDTKRPRHKHRGL